MLETKKTLEAQEIQAILPHRYPMLMIDRVLDLKPGESVVAQKNVSINEQIFQGIFPVTRFSRASCRLKQWRKQGQLLCFRCQTLKVKQLISAALEKLSSSHGTPRPCFAHRGHFREIDRQCRLRKRQGLRRRRYGLQCRTCLCNWLNRPDSTRVRKWNCVQKSTRCQPWRDRGPHHSNVAGNGHHLGGGVFERRSPQPTCLLADEAICIGGPRATDSYLNMRNVVSAAILSGAEAVHPGFGFLSENAEFAKLVTDAGLAFIGPKPIAIEQMGDKAVARQTMIDIGVPVIPAAGRFRMSIQHWRLHRRLAIR